MSAETGGPSVSEVEMHLCRCHNDGACWCALLLEADGAHSEYVGFGFRAKLGIIDHPNDTFGQEAHLHQFIHTHAGRREDLGGEETKGRCNVKRFHWDQRFSRSLLKPSQ